jgi:LmbE family N-acetylglucosaminyl deacetylase
MANIVAIFAHPDDESFGPGGTLALLSKDHAVYIICVTSGDVGGPGDIREKEIEASAKILGIKKVFLLRYGDGTLSNNIYHNVADDIQQILNLYKPEKLLTFESKGISGHIDHIAISMVTTFLFEKLEYAKELWYFCISKAHRTLIKDYFIYFPQGYERDEVDEVVDVSDVWDVRIASMHCHQSQKSDMEFIEKNLQSLPREEYFLVKRK